MLGAGPARLAHSRPLLFPTEVSSMIRLPSSLSHSQVPLVS